MQDDFRLMPGQRGDQGGQGAAAAAAPLTALRLHCIRTKTLGRVCSAAWAPRCGHLVLPVLSHDAAVELPNLLKLLPREETLAAA